MLLAARRVMQFLLPCRRLQCHTLALGNRKRTFLEAFQEQFTLSSSQACRQRTHEPVFQDANAADTSLVEIRPLIDQRLDLDLERNLLQQGQQSALERLLIGFMLKLIAREVDFQAPPGGLPTEIAQG